jgi:hypothetical protein
LDAPASKNPHFLIPRPNFGGGLGPSFFNQPGTTTLERVTIVSTDQRGFGRPASGLCDIGAYEYYPDAAYIPLFSR